MNDYQFAFISVSIASFITAIFVMGYFHQPDLVIVMGNLLNSMFCVLCATVTGDE